MAAKPRELVRSVLPPRMAEDIWSSQYHKVMPITFLDFELSAILPAVFYMFRFGHRRGTGNFLDTYGPKDGSIRDRRQETTIDCVAKKLANSRYFAGFNGEVEQAILGDLLLGFSLENIRRDLGRDKQLQRVAPAHYMASWIDLPDRVAHLRYVPEMIVAILANQGGESVEATSTKNSSWFSVARHLEDNVLLHAFSQGVTREGLEGNYAGDKFDERCTSVGLDQLLMIRLATLVGRAPDKLRPKKNSGISNQLPIAEKATKEFSEDIRRFLRAYAKPIPRHSLVNILESCIAIGLSTIFSSVVEIAFKWAAEGSIIEPQRQIPAPIFVDCSNGIDKRIRRIAELSLDDLTRRFEQVPVVLMMLRVLDYLAVNNRRLQKEKIRTRPYSREWLQLLGDILHSRHDESKFIHDQIEQYGYDLAEELKEDYSEESDILLDEDSEPNPICRFSNALSSLMVNRARKQFFASFDSALHMNRPNGLAQKRKTSSGSLLVGPTRRQRDVRSLVFNDSVLDYLVHLHLLRNGNRACLQSLSFGEFLTTIQNRYGFYVDQPPKGMVVSNEILLSNRKALERRLRDLGLFVGVNDAEAMKRLRPRFQPESH